MIEIKVSSAALEALQQDEFGSYEDHGCPAPGEDGYGSETGCTFTEHVYNILGRHLTTGRWSKLELRDEYELYLVEYHALDNSIDKAQGNADWGTPDETADYRKALRQFTRLRERILAAAPAGYDRKAVGRKLWGEPV